MPLLAPSDGEQADVEHEDVREQRERPVLARGERHWRREASQKAEDGGEEYSQLVDADCYAVALAQLIDSEKRQEAADAVDKQLAEARDDEERDCDEDDCDNCKQPNGQCQQPGGRDQQAFHQSFEKRKNRKKTHTSCAMTVMRPFAFARAIAGLEDLAA